VSDQMIYMLSLLRYINIGIAFNINDRRKYRAYNNWAD